METSDTVRRAADIRTSIEELENLSRSRDSYVRSLVAKNLSATSELLSKLSADECKTVRWITALNPNTNYYTLTFLLSDPSEHIRKIAESRLRAKNT
jgi:hypothetical protein